MDEQPKRKVNRVKDYDYSLPGVYFVTICTANREKLFWSDSRGELCSPAEIPLSDIGILVDSEINGLSRIYSCVQVEKYCIMPDHVHLLISIEADEDGRPQVAPTISRVIKQFKGSLTKKAVRPIWQKSFYEHIIRNQQDYEETWKYIENNPLRYFVCKTE